MEKEKIRTPYHKIIAEFLKCSDDLADEVYYIMRYDIFHSPMDWVPLEEFHLAIVDAVNLLHKYRMESILKGEKPMNFG